MKKKLITIISITVALCVAIGYMTTNTSSAVEQKTNQEEHVVSREKHMNYNEENNPESIQFVVNKHNKLPDGYKPNDLVVPNVSFAFTGVVEKSHLRKEAAAALEKLFTLAKQEGIKLNAVSGFRSYEYQKSVYANSVRRNGQEHANRFSAKPGHSEHQTGLVMDVSANSANNELEIDFAETKEGQWLKENAHRAGFIIRYPKGKEEITGYAYEPWHIRYVGDIAEEIYKKKLTLEEYMNEKDNE
ncbi:D-alanyl-D-alanine carboxypeptidase [Bacillus manliponensis]|uniref:D-alanyl-D-alanine carboxypeptidase n=1 Tax=Bacillus manliponensis TaxID=574376 RepID=A0A073K2K3_9BACI|nr:M15 family metallopeptidase [Bacillus manliponensis]KEK20730.1 D-alanyl-D-alanine carboxypeptidase [Bacillus manliponensis]